MRLSELGVDVEDGTVGKKYLIVRTELVFFLAATTFWEQTTWHQ